MKTFFSILKSFFLLLVKVCVLLIFCCTKLGEEILKAINTALSDHIQSKN